MVLAAGCTFQKPGKFNKAMQNLTAHYNIVFNANELLRQKQDSYALAFIDSYGQLLNVYQDTIAKSKTFDKDLDAVITRANTIISDKDQSNYVGDAYLILAKANFLGANYFNAAEYCNYVLKSYPKEAGLVEEAAVWKARSLLYLNNFIDARLALDTALTNINPKKKINADVYATRLQYDIDVQNYTEGEKMAKKAVTYCRNTNQKLRWTFILAQLEELNNENTAAIVNYISISRSNVAFEMAFNANLNRIRIEDQRNGVKISRIDRLLALLKNPNNKDFTDQIYYQVGEIYMLEKNVNSAIKYYKMAIGAGKGNQNQKGLAYLRIADIDFNNKADYVNAKKYYDSTLTSLSPNFPGYLAIQKKANNLQVLVDKLQIIAREDTLQMLAKLDDKARQKRIDVLVTQQILQEQQIAANNANNLANNAPANNTVRAGSGNFYFYNANAVSRGYADFKLKWGTRKLEDDWRRSNRAASIVNSGATIQNTDPDALPANMRKSTNDVAAGKYRQQIIQDLPLTPQLLEQSNLKIYNAYLDIANFYRDILDDKKDAIATYLLLLNNYPNDPGKAVLYYNLYRLYSETDVAKSDFYKNKLLKEYPETAFARVIIDPDYGKTSGDKNAKIGAAYNKVYDAYAHKKYQQVITSADSLLTQSPDNIYAAQLSYLRAISAGHQEALPAFKTNLEQIATKYPDNGLITPLVKQHLAYIMANKTELGQQPFALMNNDTTEALFAPPIDYQKQTAYRRPPRKETFIAPAAAKPVTQAPAAKVPAPVPVAATPPPVAAPKKTVKEAPVYFTLRDSTNYFFVINVSTGTTDLASSRFGIGQFNRANYGNTSIRHFLKRVGQDNQLILVGRFFSLTAAKNYARAIVPLLPEIMKVPADKYGFFIITQENLDKLAGKSQLDSYYDYYQQIY